MYASLMEAVDLEAEMLTSLDRGDFVPYFQPIVDLATSEIVGMEALIRWHHPGRGILFPNTFIQIAEDSGLINRLGREVLFETCRYTAEWLKFIPAERLKHVAINVSGRQLEHTDLVEEVRAATTKYGLDPGIIVLEITESVLMQNVVLAIEQLTRLKALGVRIALDDFGTGYSSLSHVHRFPIDILKIDRSFIESINKSDGSALVRAIIGLANALDLKVVAEGIEKIGQLAPLQQLDCQFGQGYYFGKPETPEKTRQLLSEHTSRARLALVRSDGPVTRLVRALPDLNSG
jgi:EAL domain-containing protein (putative c-di-GMP-specific phosphodiesterase class I)